MQTIPLLDTFGGPLLTAVFVALLWLQWRFPLRQQHFAALRRIVRNLLLSAPSHAVFRFAMLPVPLAIAAWAQDRHLSLLNSVTLPGWARAVVTFPLMDYAYWWWHWANHMVPLFWRFHMCTTPISTWT
jgi:sterol desaturase/sphingolipid hydroxylase (fatty acid hydroxylase superfamily)